jgi:hypothetical protein
LLALEFAWSNAWAGLGSNVHWGEVESGNVALRVADTVMYKPSISTFHFHSIVLALLLDRESTTYQTSSISWYAIQGF